MYLSIVITNLSGWYYVVDSKQGVAIIDAFTANTVTIAGRKLFEVALLEFMILSFLSILPYIPKSPSILKSSNMMSV
jgi:hypothetical protein